MTRTASSRGWLRPRPAALAGAVVAFVAACLLGWGHTTDGRSLSDVLICVAALYGGAAALAAGARTTGRLRLAWRLVALGALCWGLGQGHLVGARAGDRPAARLARRPGPRVRRRHPVHRGGAAALPGRPAARRSALAPRPRRHLGERVDPARRLGHRAAPDLGRPPGRRGHRLSRRLDALPGHRHGGAQPGTAADPQDVSRVANACRHRRRGHRPAGHHRPHLEHPLPGRHLLGRPPARGRLVRGLPRARARGGTRRGRALGRDGRPAAHAGDGPAAVRRPAHRHRRGRRRPGAGHQPRARRGRPDRAAGDGGAGPPGRRGPRHLRAQCCAGRARGAVPLARPGLERRDDRRRRRRPDRLAERCCRARLRLSRGRADRSAARRPRAPARLQRRPAAVRRRHRRPRWRGDRPAPVARHREPRARRPRGVALRRVGLHRSPRQPRRTRHCHQHPRHQRAQAARAPADRAGLQRRADRARQPGPDADPHRRGAGLGRRRTTRRSRCCSSTSTGSRRSTTASATRSATCCCSRPPAGSSTPYGPTTRWPGSVATSSPYCCRRAPSSAVRARSPGGCCSVLEEPFLLGDSEAAVSASIGVAVARPGDDPDSLVRDADLAMYRAKSLGKSRVELFEPEMYAHVLRKVELERELRGRDRAGRAGGRLPARRRHAYGSRCVRGSLAALGLSASRAGRAAGVRALRRGERAHRPDRPLGPRPGLPPGRPLAPAGHRHPAVGQRLGPPAAGAAARRVGGDHAAGAPARRRATSPSS